MQDIKHKVRLQSAMEYLMTYGWAILVIAVVLGVLFQLGIFSSSSFSSTACISATGYLCQNPSLSSNGLLTVQIGEVGGTITVTGLGCSNTTTPSSYFSPTNMQLSSGGTSSAAFYCPLSTNTIGTSFSGTLWIQYGSGTQTGLTAQIGTINAKATSAGPPFIIYSAITRVQGNARGTTSSGSSISVTMASTPIVGNLIIVVIGTTTTTSIGYSVVSGITQTGVTWTQQSQGEVQAASIWYVNSEIWVGVVGSGASNSITITLSQPSYAVADVSEYSGLATSGFLDQKAASAGWNSGSTGVTALTSQANELWIGGVTAYNYGALAVSSNGFTFLDGAWYNPVAIGYLEKIVSNTGSAGSSVTGATIGCIATFKAANALVP